MPSCWHCGDETDAPSCDGCGAWIVELVADRVPRSVQHLLPLARQWGIADDGYRWNAVERATAVERSQIVEAVGSAPDDLWEWLAGPKSLDPSPTNEYVAVTCLTMAYDQARAYPKSQPDPGQG